MSPPQITSCSISGPVLLAYHWLDAQSAREHRTLLSQLGYLPSMPFNAVIDAALRECGLNRAEIYITQAFHLLPRQRSAVIPPRDVDACFDAITRHELIGRTVIALGNEAGKACRRAGIEPEEVVPHPSARGLTYREKAERLARAMLCWRRRQEA